MKKKAVKLVVIGDASCGKSSLIHAHAAGQFQEQYVPTAFDDFSVEALVDGKMDVITISDTAGEDDFSSMRPLSYPNADCFIFCYAIDQPGTLKNLRDKWMPEIRHFCPSTPVLVVGNKKDLRETASENAIPTKEAIEIVKQITALPLIECSAKTRENIRLVFDSALSAVSSFRNRHKNKVIQSIMKLRLVF
ncbi:hypothetical protein M3Y97_00550000 [Aphelenchoides bicaudatus]|nr:hypothetical protein M3Y97_00550000 [Aphelenchoides bicaudatus]